MFTASPALRIALAAGAALAVFVAIVLAYAAVSAGHMQDMGAATLLALAAVFITQAVIGLARITGRR